MSPSSHCLETSVTVNYAEESLGVIDLTLPEEELALPVAE